MVSGGSSATGCKHSGCVHSVERNASMSQELAVKPTASNNSKALESGRTDHLRAEYVSIFFNDLPSHLEIVVHLFKMASRHG
jgi:hypothetical protein